MTNSINEIQGLNHYHNQFRNKIFAIEAEMKKMPQAELKVKHFFVPGVYIRELFVPKGAVLVGKIHKYKQFHWLMKGKLKVSIGDKIEYIEAPAAMITEAGSKRVAYALEDTVWLMVHGTYETDLDKIEHHFIAQSEREWLEFCKSEPMLPLEGDNKCLT